MHALKFFVQEGLWRFGYCLCEMLFTVLKIYLFVNILKIQPGRVTGTASTNISMTVLVSIYNLPTSFVYLFELLGLPSQLLPREESTQEHSCAKLLQLPSEIFLWDCITMLKCRGFFDRKQHFP